MRSHTCLVVIVLTTAALLGCVNRSTHDPAATTAKQATNYPFSEIETVYDAVLSGMTKSYFKNYPEIDKEHTAKMREFIAAGYPRERFVNEMVRDEVRPKFQRAMNDTSYRDTKEFKDAFEVTVAVSVSMAKMMLGGQRDIYVARFVEKNPTKAELFSFAKTADEQQFVSWVSEEITPSAPPADLGPKYKFEPGDRVFAFSSPEQTWADLCGCRGYLILRGGKLEAIVTTIN